MLPNPAKEKHLKVTVMVRGLAVSSDESNGYKTSIVLPDFLCQLTEGVIVACCLGRETCRAPPRPVATSIVSPCLSRMGDSLYAQIVVVAPDRMTGIYGNVHDTSA